MEKKKNRESNQYIYLLDIKRKYLGRGNHLVVEINRTILVFETIVGTSRLRVWIEDFQASCLGEKKFLLIADTNPK